MWKQRGVTQDELRPITTPEDFINSVLNPKGTALSRHVTATQQKFYEITFTGLSGRDIFDKIKEFQQRYGSELEKLVEQELTQPDPPPAGELRGLSLLRKSEHLSNAFRTKGNDFFKSVDFPMAQRCYTLAASYAPPGSHAEKLAYSNRSACFLYLGRWKKCLEEIERFEKIDSGVPVERDLLKRIEERKVKCLEELGGLVSLEEKRDKDVQFAKEFFYTLKNESKIFPGAEEFVGIRMDKEKDRCLYNKGPAPIEPGTLIILDKAYIHGPEEPVSFQTEHCNACFRDLRGGGIPCPSCVFHLYCSEACKDSEFAKIHSKYECKVLPYLHELRWGRATMMHMAVSILLKLGPQGFLAKVQKSTESDNPIPGITPEGVYDPTAFETVDNLSWNQQVLDPAFVNDACIFAVLATKIVDDVTDYFSSLKETEPELDLTWVKNEFIDSLVLLKVITQINSHGIGRVCPPPESSPPAAEDATNFEFHSFGFGLFPVASLLNHSCDPNVIYIPLPGNNMALVTTQHVAPEQEFFVGYGARYPDPKSERQFDLRRKYGFSCGCPPCKYDWPWELVPGEAWGKPLHSGQICPECRPTLDMDSNGREIFSEIAVKDSPTHFSCPRCSWKLEKSAFATLYKNIGKLEETALPKIREMTDLRTAFTNFQQVVKFFDSNFMRPSGVLRTHQTLMEQAVLLLAKRLWDENCLDNTA